MAGKYDNLKHGELVKLLESRDRKRKLGLVWEREEIEADRRQNADFVAAEIVPDLSDRPSPWQNLVIEADNYDALRWLRMTHKGQVKCIYIDPPYNTGAKDWVYNDHYANPDDAYFHSTWLEFLYQRLTIARDLLTEDGVILVSINDDQRARLELLMDEAMPGMRLGSMAWRSRIGSNADQSCFLSQDHEHILVYGKPGFRFAGTEKTFSMYRFYDEDRDDHYRLSDLTLGFSWQERPNLFYPLQDPDTGYWYPCNPNGVWRYASRFRSKSTRTKFMEEWIGLGRIRFPEDPKVRTWHTEEDLREAVAAGEIPMSGKTPLISPDLPGFLDWIGCPVAFGTPSFKRYKGELRNPSQPLSSWVYPRSEASNAEKGQNVIVTGTNDEGAKSIRDVFGSKVFNYAKPVSLIRELVRQSTGPGEIVLDFFAGSGTTAQAVMEVNAEDDGDRNFIMVSSTEATEDNPEKNICRDVTAERIRRLNGSGDRKFQDLTAGFAYLRTRNINFEDLDYDLEPGHIWIALQAMHDLPLTAFDAGAAWNVHETEGLILAFATRFDQDFLPWLESLGPRNVIVYSDAPGQLAHEIGERNIEILPARETLVRRFRK